MTQAEQSPATDGDGLVQALLNLVLEQDHKRLCEGLHYVCGCGYDNEVFEAAKALQADIARLQDPSEGVERYRHKKRGTVYTVLGEAELQMSNDYLVDGSELVVYRGEDGKLWVRQIDEFHDGRFEAVVEGEVDNGL